MRTLIGIFLLGARLVAADYTVHEWGTFTSVSGSDGQLLSGLEAEEAPLPSFVGAFTALSPAFKGLSQPVRGVTIKMETPVVYFYSAEPRRVNLAIGFEGGAIGQWYPDRSGGEELAPTTPVDFANPHHGSISWRIDVLGHASEPPISAKREQETPQWPRARVGDANRVRGPKGEVEGFVFYRGMGNFALPLRVSAAADGALTLENTGRDDIPYLLVYDGRSGAMVAWQGPLAAGAVHQVTAGHLGRRVPFSPVREHAFPDALVAAGLSRAEAKALLDTWRESYFDKPGLRVFWIVPRAFTDAVLPMTLTPAPAKLERVLVGRSEVLTRDFERKLLHDFAVDGGKRWENDRYFLAYQERVKRLGGVVRVAAATGDR